MTIENKATKSVTLSDLLVKSINNDDSLTNQRRAGIYPSLRSGQFQHERTKRVGDLTEPKIHAVGLNIRYLCRCQNDSSVEMEETECSCFLHDDLACRVLYLSRNNLSSGKGLDKFENLTSLSLSDNLFDHIPLEIKRLRRLECFNFEGNVLAEATPHARERIISYIPNLRKLDGVPISDVDKRRSIKIISEEFILKNVIFLLDRLHRAQSTWEEEYEVICMDAQDEISAIIGATDSETIEDYIEIFGNAMTERLVFEEDPCIWSRVKSVYVSSGVSSWNHGLVILAKNLWREIQYPTKLNLDNAIGHEFASFFREMTSCLEVLDSFLQDKAEGSFSEAQGIIMMVWAQFYILNSHLKLSLASQASLAKDPSIILDEDDCSSDAKSIDEQEDNSPKNEGILRLQGENERLKIQMKDQVERLDKLSQDKDELVSVLSTLQESLEHMNLKKEEVLKCNESLAARLQTAIHEKDECINKLYELQSAHQQYKKEISHELTMQKACFDESMSSLLGQLDVLKKEPRISMHIEIINPEIHKVLSKKDAEIALMEKELDYYHHKQDAEIKADAFKSQWQREHIHRTKILCFTSWRDTTRYLHDLDVFKKNLEAIVSFGRTQLVLSTWQNYCIRSRHVTAFSLRAKHRANTRLIQITMNNWIRRTHQNANVRLYIKSREDKMKRQVIDQLQMHQCFWHDRITTGFKVATSFHKSRALNVVFSEWLDLHRSRECTHLSRLQSMSMTRERKLLDTFLCTWRQVSTQAQIEALGRSFSNHRIATKSFRVLLYNKRRTECLETFFSRMALCNQMQTLGVLLNSWRNIVATTKARLIQECFVSWRRQLTLQKYLRESSRKQIEKDRHNVRDVFLCWRDRAWKLKNRQHQNLSHQIERLEHIAVLRECFLRWNVALLSAKVNNVEDKLRDMDTHATMMAKSCNSMKDALITSHMSHIQSKDKALTQLHAQLRRLEHESRTVQKDMGRSLTDLDTMTHDMKRLESTKKQQDVEIAALNKTVEQLRKENHGLAIRLRASETIKASISTRATRALKTSSLATDTLLSVWFDQNTRVIN